MAVSRMVVYPGLKAAGFLLEGQPFIQGRARYGKRFTYVGFMVAFFIGRNCTFAEVLGVVAWHYQSSGS